MSVVIISADAFSRSQEIAAAAAALLGYRFLPRDEVIAEAARVHHASADDLLEAIDGRAGWRRLPTRERRVRLALLQATLADHLVEGDCVCAGLAAHLYVTGISHVVKVRLVAALERRIAEAAARQDVGEAAARKLVHRLDKRRRRWVATLFGVDEDHPAHFDLVVDLARTDTDGAAAVIADTASQRRFRPMSYSRGQLRDFTLASKVRATLVEIDPEVVVRATDGVVHIEAKASGKDAGRAAAALRKRALAVPQVQDVEVLLINDVFAKAALSMR